MSRRCLVTAGAAATSLHRLFRLAPRQPRERARARFLVRAGGERGKIVVSQGHERQWMNYSKRCAARRTALQRPKFGLTAESKPVYFSHAGDCSAALLGLLLAALCRRCLGAVDEAMLLRRATPPVPATSNTARPCCFAPADASGGHNRRDPEPAGPRRSLREPVSRARALEEGWSETCLLRRPVLARRAGLPWCARGEDTGAGSVPNDERPFLHAARQPHRPRHRDHGRNDARYFVGMSAGVQASCAARNRPRALVGDRPPTRPHVPQGHDKTVGKSLLQQNTPHQGRRRGQPMRPNGLPPASSKA